jgi:hypothetical protein
MKIEIDIFNNFYTIVNNLLCNIKLIFKNRKTGFFNLLSINEHFTSLVCNGFIKCSVTPTKFKGLIFVEVNNSIK